jgi:toxin ParE1/3/4
MSWHVIRSKAAKADLVDLWLYIASENPEAADRQISRIEETVDRLSDFPRLGPARDDVSKGVRGLVVNRHLVLYRVREAEKQIELLRVIDGRRDLSAIFIGGES